MSRSNQHQVAAAGGRGRKARLLAAGAALAVATGAAAGAMWAGNGAEPALSGRFDGPAVKLGAGTARTFVVMEDGVPLELGIAIDEAAMADPGEGMEMIPFEEHFLTCQLLLDLPAEAAGLPFTFAELDWNPMGHEPPGIYDSPHFDFHFYLISREEREAIVPSDPEFERKARELPEPEYVPAGYISVDPPAVVPMMGNHLLDPASPELTGEGKFTTTFIYGSWDGRLIFFEPMITQEFIRSTSSFEAEVPTARRYSEAGWYPTAYSVRHDRERKEYRISLTRFEKRG